MTKRSKFSSEKPESVRLSDLAISLGNKALKKEKSKSALIDKALIAYCRHLAGKRELEMLKAA